MAQRPDTGGSGSDMAKGFSQASWGLSVAFGFVGILLGGWFAGRLIDEWLGIEPWAQVVGAIAGWIGGVALVFYASLRKQQD